MDGGQCHLWDAVSRCCGGSPQHRGLGRLIVYFVVCPEGLGSRLVGLAPFVLVGDLAYTLYLVHWPSTWP